MGALNKTVGSNVSQGAAYVYTTTSNWASSAQAAELTASNGAANDYFGISVALSSAGTTALVGAPNKTVGTNGYQGAAYVYTTTSNWAASAQAAELTASNGAANDTFGGSVVLSSTGTTALVGAPNKTVASSTEQGAAYFFGDSDLSAVLSAPTTVQAGASVSSQYILTNASATASVALTVMLPLPATNAGYVSASASQGSCSYDSTAKVATCALGSIPGNGGTASATLNLKATGAAGATIAQSGQLANGSPPLAQTASTTIGGGLPSPPTLSGLTNVTVTEPAVGTETVTLSGTGPLTVTATSSNTTLLPAANITGASTCTAAGSCTLTLTPVSGQSGSTTVTITVTDSYGQSATGNFTFTVNNSSPPPPPPSSGGGGAFGAWALLGLLGLVLWGMLRRRMSFHRSG